MMTITETNKTMFQIMSVTVTNQSLKATNPLTLTLSYGMHLLVNMVLNFHRNNKVY